MHIRGVAHRSIICFNRRSSSYNIFTCWRINQSSNPFVQYFEYDANSNEGYWSYDHLVFQLEVRIDILKFLYPTPEQDETQILVEHSCSHDRQRQDGLNVKTMNIGYGGI